MRSWWGSRVHASALLLVAGVSGAAPSIAACGGSTAEPHAADAAPDVDVVAEDAGPLPSPGEAGTDAKADAAAKSFCATRSPEPKFCDDFDDGDLDDDWDVLTVVNGDADLDPLSATSVPASFAVATLPVTSMQSAHVHLRTTATGTATGHVVLAFDMMLASTTFTHGVVAIARLDVSSDHFFTLYLRDGDLDAPAATLEEISPGGTTRHLLSKLPPANEWTHVTIDVALDTAKATVLWGTDKALDQAPIAAGTAKDPTIRIGAVYIYGPAVTFEARFDDVTLDF